MIASTILGDLPNWEFLTEILLQGSFKLCSLIQDALIDCLENLLPPVPCTEGPNLSIEGSICVGVSLMTFPSIHP